MAGALCLVGLDRARRIRRARLVRYSTDHPSATSEMVRKRLADSASNARTDALKHTRSGVLGLLELRAREAGLNISPAGSVTAIAVISALVLAGLVLGIRIPAIFAVVAAPATGWILINGLFDLLRSRRMRRFTEALPDCLDVFARGLRAGQPLGEALGLVASHTKGVAQEEFLTCREEHLMGMPLGAALAGVAARVTTPEARFLAVATNLQAEVGGNLIETLENLANLLRARRKLRKKAAALSAETRISAVILSSLPFVIGMILFVINPSYLMPLINDPRGRVLALLGVLSLCFGIGSMYKLSRIDF